jgi:hypothetical protein
LSEVTPIRKRGTKPKVPTKTALLKKCDTLFSRIVRSRGACENCHDSNPLTLQCAHGFSRRYRGTRWDERNSCALCRSCHVFFTHRPIEWDIWLQRTWGLGTYEQMKELALNLPTPDPAAELVRLTARWAEIERAA